MAFAFELASVLWRLIKPKLVAHLGCPLRTLGAPSMQRISLFSRSALAPTANSRNRPGRSSAFRAPLSLRGKCARIWRRFLRRVIASRPITACLPRRPISRWERSRTNRGGSPAKMRLAGNRIFAGALGTQSLKVFDLAIARTGLSERDAREAGFDPVTTGFEANDHKAYYPGAVPLRIRLTGDRRTGRLLGGQILGNRKAEISKRIDIIATAIFQDASVDDLNDLDLSYTPPFSSPWDPVQMAAQAWCSKLPQLVGSI
jgi:hypothetical protein